MELLREAVGTAVWAFKWAIPTSKHKATVCWKKRSPVPRRKPGAEFKAIWLTGLRDTP